MGTIQHHAVIATHWKTEALDELKVWVAAGNVDGGEIVYQHEPKVNGYFTIVMLPDGSKEGWKDSEDGDKRRERLLAYLRKAHWDAVEISYGEVGINIDNGFDSAARWG